MTICIEKLVTQCELLNGLQIFSPSLLASISLRLLQSGYRQMLQYLQLAGFPPEAIVIASTLIHPYRYVPSVADLLRTVELIIESGPTIRTELE